MHAGQRTTAGGLLGLAGRDTGPAHAGEFLRKRLFHASVRPYTTATGAVAYSVVGHAADPLARLSSTMRATAGADRIFRRRPFFRASPTVSAGPRTRSKYLLS